MAKPELGVKRIDPETGKKFYDLNRDPIVSPYTGKSYPRSYFAAGPAIIAARDEEEAEEKELDVEEAAPDTVSLEEADEEAKGTADEALPDIDDDEVEIEDDDDTFLETEEEEDDDVADIISLGDEDEEV